MNAAPKSEVSIEILNGTPEPDVLSELLQLVTAGEEADGNPPLSEQTLVELRTASASGLLVGAYGYLGQDDETVSTDLVGAAVAVRGDRANPGTLEMVVHPAFRDSGIAAAMITALSKELDLSTLRAWAHGNHEAAAKLAERFGYAPIRELWRMRMVAGTQVPEHQIPAGITIRAFDPGTDGPGWVAANAAAFADHQEQGAMTAEDLAARMAEDWFDPAGFLLAVDESGKILGFHWTKVHPALSSPTTGEHQAIGEIYVVGVIPGAQGTGLGKVLTLAGIAHLDSLGLDALMLYVDADNTAAVALYRKLGFTKWDVDVMYAPVSLS